jgi:hypothetical protein
MPSLTKIIRHAANNGPTLKELQTTFHTSANKAFNHFDDVLSNDSRAQQLKNYKYSRQQKLVPNTMFSPDKISHMSDLEHTYRIVTDPKTGETIIGLNTFAPVDMMYAGSRAGSEIALFKFLNSSDPRSIYLPNELNNLFKDNNALSNLSRLMTWKMNSGIITPFTSLLDSDLDKIISNGYSTKAFSLRKINGGTETFDEFKRRAKPILKKYMRYVPGIGLAIAMPANQNEKGDQ